MSHRAAVLITDTYVAALRLTHRRGRRSLGPVCRAPVTECPGLSNEDDRAALAEPIAEAMQAAGAPDDPVDLILPATWCFIRRLESPGRRFHEAAAGFQLEEYLPVPLEKVTYTLLRDREQRVWAIAVPTRPCAEILNALESHGMHVEHLRVDLLAALGAAPPRERDGWVLVEDRQRAGMAFVTADADLPETLRAVLVPAEDGVSYVRQQLALAASVGEHSTNVIARCCLPDAEEHEAAANDGDGQRDSESTHGEDVPRIALSDLMVAAMTRPNQPDLRTGALAAPNRWDGVYRQAIRCAALATLLLLLAIVHARWQKRDAEGQLRQVTQQQGEVFREVLPNRPTPRSPARRLASERKQLEGLTRTAIDAGPVGEDGAPQRLDLLTDLRDFVQMLPSEVRVRLTELTLDPLQLRARGHTADHRDAERIAAAADGVTGLAARPPRTSRLKSGAVEFSIYATRDRNDE